MANSNTLTNASFSVLKKIVLAIEQSIGRQTPGCPALKQLGWVHELKVSVCIGLGEARSINHSLGFFDSCMFERGLIREVY